MAGTSASRRQTELSLWTALVVLASTIQAIVMPDGHTGKLPTLGWNSWNAYACDITEDDFRAATQALVSTGLSAAGYNYVNMDDCWSVKSGRDSNGHLVPDPTKFPNGISGVASYVHEFGLNFGIYSTAGSTTCAGYPASLGFEDVDAADFAAWGVDYLKYDNCNIPAEWADQYVACNPDAVPTASNGSCNTSLEPNLAPPGYDWSTSNSTKRFNRMRDALANVSRPILLSICIWGNADIFSWGNETGVNWRSTGDIKATWGDITRIININSFHMNSVDFWGHNDADMLEIGNGALTLQESRSHFALWAAMKSPLLIGTSVSGLSQDNLNILKNSRLLAFNQDSVYGAPAKPYKWGTNPDYTFDDDFPAEFWAGASQQGYLVLMLNTANETRQMDAVWTEIPGLAPGGYQVTDVWTGNSLGCLQSYSCRVASHDTAAILVGPAC